MMYRYGPKVSVLLGVAAFGVDMLRFHGLPFAGYVNEILVWLAVQQLGIAYAAGRYPTRRAVPLGIAGIAATALLVLFGPYPVSMVGIPGQSASNMAPATVCLLTLGVGQLGLLLAVRERLVRLAANSRLVTAIGARCMTVYLWHMSAMVVVAGIAVVGFGYTTPAPGSPAWLVVTPLWIVALALVLGLLVRVFGRFEATVGGGEAAGRPVLAVGAVCVGLLGIAAFGFADPLRALPFTAAIVIGLWLAWPAAKARLVNGMTRQLGQLIDAIFTR
jgi:hypothetical protein